LFVGIAHACGLGGSMTIAHHPMAAAVVGDQDRGDIAPNCTRFCKDDVPLLAKLPPLEDPPGDQPLVVPMAHELGVAPVGAYTLQPVRIAHSPPGVPLSIRFVHLTL